MLERTIQLKKEMRKMSKTEDKLNILHGAFVGEKCYIVTCGPSLNNIWGERVKRVLCDNLTIAVKQAYDLAPEITDFHLLNPYNYKKYKYPAQKPIIVATKQEEINLPMPGLKHDLMFTITEEANRPENMLARTRNFDDYLFTKTLNRPFGPGIIYELGIYLAVHLGVSEIIIISWDIGDVSGSAAEHHYDTSLIPDDKDNKVRALLRLYRWLSTKGINLQFVSKVIPISVQNRLTGIQLNKNYREASNKKAMTFYNAQCGGVKGEVELMAEASESLYHWLRQKGIKLSIVSDRSMAASCIPRLEL